MHRRALKRVALASIVIVAMTVSVNVSDDAGQANASVLAVPQGHRVVSVPIDETIPPLGVGDEIDFYLAPTIRAGLESDVAGVTVLPEPGVVVAIEGEALAVAVPEEVIATLLASLAEDAVLVVRR